MMSCRWGALFVGKENNRNEKTVITAKSGGNTFCLVDHKTTENVIKAEKGKEE